MNSTEQKTKEVITELEQWFSQEDCKAKFFDKPLKEIQDNLKEEKFKKKHLAKFQRVVLLVRM